MEKRLIIAGSGGQGILYFGKVMTQAAMLAGKKVTWFPSYGAEMRGGTANCTIVISDNMIGSPVILRPEILVTMNRASLERFQPGLLRGGTLVFDCSLIERPKLRRDIVQVPVPAAEMAQRLSQPRTANVILLGALVAVTGILAPEFVVGAIELSSSSAMASSSKTSFIEGVRHIEDQKSHNR